jgi:hypothetical protein
VALRDLIALYAFALKLAPQLETKLPPAVLGPRWRAAAGEGGTQRREGESPGAGGSGAVKPASYPELKASASRYGVCARMDVNDLLENTNVNFLYFEILKSSEDNGGSLPGFNAALEALFGIYEFWARAENGDSSTRNFLAAEDKVSTFLANFALLELDRAMADGDDGAPGKYYRQARDVLFFADSEAELRHTLSASERTLRSVGFDARAHRAQVMPAASLVDAEVESWLERLGPRRTRVAAAREFMERERFTGDVARWGEPYFRALEVLREEGDDSFFNQVLQTFLDNPTRSLLTHSFRYLRHFSARFFFTTAVVVALSRQSVKIPYHNYYLYRLAAYDRGYAPALKELALYDAADARKPWYWRAGALAALHTFDLPSALLDELEAFTADDNHPAVIRAARVLSRQRPAEDGGAPAAEPPSRPRDEFLEAYFQRVTTEEAPARALLEEIRGTAVGSPVFIERLHQLDLLKNNAAVKDEFLDVLDLKIAECDLAWPRLLARLEGIRNRRLR